MSFSGFHTPGAGPGGHMESVIRAPERSESMCGRRAYTSVADRESEGGSEAGG